MEKMEKMEPPRLSLALTRKRRGMSRRKLAETAQVSPTTITAIEDKGVTPRYETIHKLAAALGVRIEDIVWPGDPLGLLGD